MPKSTKRRKPVPNVLTSGNKRALTNRRLRRAAVLPLLGLLVFSACGHGMDQGSTADRVVPITMRDNKFSLSGMHVRSGTTVTFEVKNLGAAKHEVFIGDASAQRREENVMRIADQRGMPQTMSENTYTNNGIVVPPGKSANVTYTFTEPGPIFIGCHEPGHYAAGMKVSVAVR